MSLRTPSKLPVVEAELHLPIDTAATLRWFMARGMPYEVCGIVHRNHLVTQYDNTFGGDKRHGFDMEIDLNDPDIVALWHTHPNGLPMPSRDDIPCMKLLAEHGFWFPWVIVTPTTITRWTLDPAAA